MAASLRIGPRTIRRWFASYVSTGFTDLGNKPKQGRPRILSQEQVEWIHATVRDKDPLQLKFPFALWTLKSVRQAILYRFGIKVSLSTARRVLKRLGFTVQRPQVRAIQRNEKAVRDWKEKVYPDLAKRAKECGATILFADEAGMNSQYHRGTTWAPRGETPQVKFTGERFRMNMMSAISSDGDLYWKLHEGSGTAVVFREFIEQMLREIGGRKVWVIVDGHRSHTARPVKEFLAERKDDVDLYILPAYAPELNPDESIWSQIKRRVGKEFLRNKQDMKRHLIEAFEDLKANPKKVKGCFHQADCAYTLC